MKQIMIIGAPSSIGIRPYEDGSMRRLDLAPRALRDEGLVERLSALDDGDIEPPPYKDFLWNGSSPRNESGVVEYARALAKRVASACRDTFVLVLGGDCSILLGCLLGLRRPVGLAYIDAHADFATPKESQTGSVAGMCLGQAFGRGNTPLARLGGDKSLVRGEHVALIGHRDHEEAGLDELRTSGALKLSTAIVRTNPEKAAVSVLARLDPLENGFWIHLDADVLDPQVLAAVDSPVPGGLRSEELERLLVPLVRHPQALGLGLTIYDPALDPDRRGARALAALLENVLEA